MLSGEKLTRYNLGAALLCLAGIGLVALDSVEFNIGDVITLAGAVFFAIQMAVTASTVAKWTSTSSRFGCLWATAC